MYLHNATGLDEVITFGINPLIALMEHFEDEYLDLGEDPESEAVIFWNEVKAKALSIQDASKRIHEHKRMKK